jgi:hypothetical protein
VATALVTSVVIALEAAGMLARHDERRHAWIGQCARAAVASGSAEPLLLTPARRLDFHPDTVVRDLNVLADHALSDGGRGLLLQQDDVDLLPFEAKRVLESLLSCGNTARGWSLLLATKPESEVEISDADVLDLRPLTRRQIFRAASAAAGSDERRSRPGVMSNQTAGAVAEAAVGKPSLVAFCLHRMWVNSKAGPARRLSLSCRILRELLALSDARDHEQAPALFDAVDELDENELFGLHFLASSEAMSVGAD